VSHSMYFHFIDTDELWFMLIDPQGLIWFWESYCLKNGRLVLVSYPKRGLGMKLDWYISLSVQH